MKSFFTLLVIQNEQTQLLIMIIIKLLSRKVVCIRPVNPLDLMHVYIHCLNSTRLVHILASCTLEYDHVRCASAMYRSHLLFIEHRADIFVLSCMHLQTLYVYAMASATVALYSPRRWYNRHSVAVSYFRLTCGVSLKMMPCQCSGQLLVEY